MSSITACPQCQTRFRVTEEQLQMRNGNVRCGRCAHVFNALESLIEASPQLPEETPAPAQLPGLAEQAQETLPAWQMPVTPEPEALQQETPPPGTSDDDTEPLFELEITQPESLPGTEEALFELEITQPEAPADAAWLPEFIPKPFPRMKQPRLSPLRNMLSRHSTNCYHRPSSQSQSQSQSQKVKLKPNPAWYVSSRRPHSFNPRFPRQAPNMPRPPSPGVPGHGLWLVCYC